MTEPADRFAPPFSQERTYIAQNTGDVNENFCVRLLAPALEFADRRSTDFPNQRRRGISLGGFGANGAPLTVGVSFDLTPSEAKKARRHRDEKAEWPPPWGDRATTRRAVVLPQLLVFVEGTPPGVDAAPWILEEAGVVCMGLLKGSGMVALDGAELDARGDGTSDVRLEQAAVGSSGTLFRLTIPIVPKGPDESAAYQAFIENLTKGLETALEARSLGLASLPGSEPQFTVDPLLHVWFGAASLSFRPGSLTFQPGSLTFQPGSLTFQPGSLTFQPGSLAAGSAASTGTGFWFVPSEPGKTDEPAKSDTSEKQAASDVRPGYVYVPPAILPRPCRPPELGPVIERRWQLASSMLGGERPVNVAIFDTGINSRCADEHPLLAGRLAGGDGTSHLERRPGSVVTPDFGHGTFVAGIVAQRAPLARIRVLAVSDEGGQTDAFALAANANAAWDADIVVFSFGIAAKDPKHVSILERFVGSLVGAGKVVVAAAGNVADLVNERGEYLRDAKEYPAAFAETLEGPGVVISVGAVDARRQEAPFTPRGEWITAYSYGVEVVSAFPYGEFRWAEGGPRLRFDGWATWSGSSMAAPRVAAAIADRAAADGCTVGKAWNLLQREAETVGFDGRTTPVIV